MESVVTKKFTFDAENKGMIRNTTIAILTTAMFVAPAVGQLDETWTVTLNGQTVQVNPNGSFRIPNVAAADEFGPDGPGTAPDFLSDDPLLLTGYSTSSGTTKYVYSLPFRMPQAETFVIGNLIFSDDPPPYPESIMAAASSKVLTVGEQSQITVTGTLLDGSQIDVTPSSEGTVYRVSNPSAVVMSSDGLVTALLPGTVFVTAVNFGSTSVIRIDITQATVDTTVEGFVQQSDGTGVGGATVMVSSGDETTTNTEGLYSVMAQVPANSIINATATAGEEIGDSANVPVVANGITDLGVITLNAALAEQELIFASTTLESSFGSFAIIAEDFSGNGFPDVALVDRSNYLVIHMNQGNGIFGAPIVYDVGSARDLDAADLDGDNDIDIVTVDSSNDQIGLVINNGNGTFSPPAMIGTLNNADMIAVGDVDGDLDNDVIVGSEFGQQFAVYLNPGNAVFDNGTNFSLPSRTSLMTLSNIDGDNALDLVFIAEGVGEGSAGCITATGCGTDRMGIMLGNNDGTFADPMFVNTGQSIRYFRAEDLNADNRPDLATIDGFSRAVFVSLNNGDGTFPGKATRYDIEQRPGPFLITHVNGDSIPDIVVSDRTDDAGGSVLIGNGDGTFNTERQFAMLGESVDAVAVDVDSDGDEDAIFAERWSPQVRIFRNNGVNGYYLSSSYITSISPHALAEGDFDSDGHTDVAGISFNDAGIVFGNGLGSFAGDIRVDTMNCEGFGIAAGDIDDDGDDDIVIAGSECDSCDISIIRSNGDRTFSPIQCFDLFESGDPNSIRLFDIDGDLDLDAVVGFSGSEVFLQIQTDGPSAAGIEDGGIGVLLNNGDGTFADPIVYENDLPVFDIGLGNMDNVGGMDVVAIAFDGRVAVYRGNGDGTFAEPIFQSIGAFSGRLDLADIDGDSDLDVVTSAATFFAFFNGGGGGIFEEDGQQEFPNVYVLQNLGDGNLSQATSVPAGYWPRDVALADVAGDGLPDIITSNTDASSLSVLTNLGGGNFSAPIRYATGAFPFSILTNDYDADGDTDIIVTGGEAYIDFNENQSGGSGRGITVLLNRSVTPDCDMNGTVDDLEFWSGDAPDCNLNGLPDNCDLDCDMNGEVDVCEIDDQIVDCNSNLLLDGCETDCDGNDVPDDCDLSAGEFDCNSNGILDSCDAANGLLADDDGNGFFDACERILFVDGDLVGDGDGMSWLTAFQSLTNAIDLASSYPPGSRTQVWVKTGTYVPGTSRFATFNMRNGVELYGGFAGNEDAASFNLADRDLVANATVLSGDINGDDPDIQPFIDCFSGPGFDLETGCDAFDLDMDGDVDRDDQEMFVADADNVFHVVYARDVNETAMIDGFTIVGGNADGGSNNNAGGGIFIGLFPLNASPVVRNCTLINNFGSVQGGAIWVSELGTQPRIEHCTFILNRSGTAGGAFSIVRQSRPTLINNTFIKNSSTDGGAIASTDSSRPVIYNSLFVQNMGHGRGGAYYNLGSNGLSTLVNCHFIGNGSVLHGSVSRNGSGGLSFVNCTMAGNVSELGSVHVNDAFNPSTTYRNCILWNNTNRDGVVSTPQVRVTDGAVTITNSNVENGWNGPGMSSVIDTDPMFVDQAGIDGIIGTIDDNLRLLIGSPSVNSGDNTFLPTDAADLDGDGDTDEQVPIDYDGNTRIQDGTIDMGPFELMP